MKPDYTQVSGGQLALLLITLVGATALLFSPTMAIEATKQDAWFPLLIIATLYGLMVVWLTTKLALRFEGKAFGEYTRLILGNWLSRVVGLLYLLYLMFVILVIVREFGSFLSAAFMPETPLVVFSSTLLLLAAFAATGGIEVIARLNQFLLPLAIFSLALTFTFILKDVDLLNLLPILDHDLITLLQASAVPSAFRGEVFILMWLVYHLKKPKESTKKGAAAVIFLGITLAIDAVLVIGVLGQNLAAKVTFPTLVLIRYAESGTFFTRIEGLVMALWVAGVIVKASLFLYVALETATQALPWRKNPWYLAFGMTIILIPGSLYFVKNDEQIVWILKNVHTVSALVFQLALPAILLLVAVIRKKGVKSGCLKRGC